MRIGVIADDFTGATDIASFFVQNGMTTVQLCKVNASTVCPKNVDVIVISHKTRSCEVNKAIAEINNSLDWLLQNDCPQVFFKYCSTFDSTQKGNIGPVTDYIMDRLNCNFTIFSPSLPVNGRTVYKGHLFVDNKLLSESGMKNHPITPMTDSNVINLVQMQSKYKCGLLDIQTLESGSDAIYRKIDKLINDGYKYAVVDATNIQHLITQGKIFKDYRFVTGGSGLAIGLAQAIKGSSNLNEAYKKGMPNHDKSVILSGSCSVMTNKQVNFYKDKAPCIKVDVQELMENQDVNDSIVDKYALFVLEHINENLAPLVYATDDPSSLERVLKQYGNKASDRIEHLFYKLAQKLNNNGVHKFIVAGGETSGTVTQALDIQGFYIGPVIAPGVPWVRSLDNKISLTLKSGNFGFDDFFERAQKDF